MYAVIQEGGKQYRVEKGDVIKVEQREGDAGQSIDFEQILMFSDGDTHKVGSPTLPGAKVTGVILEQGRAKKVIILKFRRRKHHMKRQGHRQNYTAIRITDIVG